MTSEAVGLTPPELNVIIEDFERGVAAVLNILEMKWAFWESLPWLLCGVGATSREAGRACAQRALDIYDKNPVAGAHHRVSNLYLAHGSFLRAQLQNFVQGT